MIKSITEIRARFSPADFAKVWVVALVVSLGVIGSLVQRGFFADGAHFFLTIIDRGEFFIPWAPRTNANLFTQTPIVLGLLAGVESIDVLAAMFNWGLVFIPTLIWASALFIHYRTQMFWWVLLAYSVTALTSGFMAISESYLTYSIVGLITALLLKNKLKALDLLLLMAGSFVLLAAYEAMAYLGVLLAFISIDKLLSARATVDKEKFQTVILGSTALLLVTSSVLALTSINVQNQRNPSVTGGLMDTLLAKLLSGPSLVVIGVFLLLLIASALRARKIRVFIGSGIVIISTIHAISPNLWISPAGNYEFRALASIALFFVVFGSWLSTRPNFQESLKVDSLRALASMSIFVSLMVPQISHNLGWYGWVETFKVTLVNLDGWKTISETDLPISDYYIFSWSWTHAAMSLIYRGDSPYGILNNPEWWGTFDPWSPSGGMGDPISDNVDR
jgi:hypothetical protein